MKIFFSYLGFCLIFFNLINGAPGINFSSVSHIELSLLRCAANIKTDSQSLNKRLSELTDIDPQILKKYVSNGYAGVYDNMSYLYKAIYDEAKFLEHITGSIDEISGITFKSPDLSHILIYDIDISNPDCLKNYELTKYTSLYSVKHEIEKVNTNKVYKLALLKFMQFVDQEILTQKNIEEINKFGLKLESEKGLFDSVKGTNMIKAKYFETDKSFSFLAPLFLKTDISASTLRLAYLAVMEDKLTDSELSNQELLKIGIFLKYYTQYCQLIHNEYEQSDCQSFLLPYLCGLATNLDHIDLNLKYLDKVDFKFPYRALTHFVMAPVDLSRIGLSTIALDMFEEAQSIEKELMTEGLKDNDVNSLRFIFGAKLKITDIWTVINRINEKSYEKTKESIESLALKSGNKLITSLKQHLLVDSREQEVVDSQYRPQIIDTPVYEKRIAEDLFYKGYAKMNINPLCNSKSKFQFAMEPKGNTHTTLDNVMAKFNLLAINTSASTCILLSIKKVASLFNYTVCKLNPELETSNTLSEKTIQIDPIIGYILQSKQFVRNNEIMRIITLNRLTSQILSKLNTVEDDQINSILEENFEAISHDLLDSKLLTEIQKVLEVIKSFDLREFFMCDVLNNMNLAYNTALDKPFILEDIMSRQEMDNLDILDRLNHPFVNAVLDNAFLNITDVYSFMKNTVSEQTYSIIDYKFIRGNFDNDDPRLPNEKLAIKVSMDIDKIVDENVFLDKNLMDLMPYIKPYINGLTDNTSCIENTPAWLRDAYRVIKNELIDYIGPIVDHLYTSRCVPFILTQKIVNAVEGKSETHNEQEIDSQTENNDVDTQIQKITRIVTYSSFLNDFFDYQLAQNNVEVKPMSIVFNDIDKGIKVHRPYICKSQVKAVLIDLFIHELVNGELIAIRQSSDQSVAHPRLDFFDELFKLYDGYTKKTKELDIGKFKVEPIPFKMRCEEPESVSEMGSQQEDVKLAKTELLQDTLEPESISQQPQVFNIGDEDVNLEGTSEKACSSKAHCRGIKQYAVVKTIDKDKIEVLDKTQIKVTTNPKKTMPIIFALLHYTPHTYPVKVDIDGEERFLALRSLDAELTKQYHEQDLNDNVLDRSTSLDICICFKMANLML